MLNNLINRVFVIINTIYIKLKYGKSFSCQGLYYGKKDTRLNLTNGGTLVLGDRVSFQEGCHMTATAGGKMIIGNNVPINRYCIFICRESIKIGDKCMFGPNVTIYDHDHKFDYEGVRHQDYNSSPVEIGENCWIGANTVILRGTKIGDNSVIGAGCIVKGEIHPNSLVTAGRDLSIVPLMKK